MDTQERLETEKSPTQLFNEAALLSNELKFAESAELFRRILEKSPSFSEAADGLAVVLSNLAVIQSRNGEFGDAAASLIESLCLNPGSEALRAMLSETLLHHAQREITAGRGPEAFLALGKSLRITRDSSPQQQNLVLDALALDSYSATPGMSWAEKLAQVERVIDRVPDHALPKIVHVVVMVKLCADALDTPALDHVSPALHRSALHAIWLLDAGHAESPVVTSAINALAVAHSRYGNPDQGLELLERLLRLDPMKMELHQNKMFAFLTKGDLASAWCREHWEDFNRACTPPMWDGHTPDRIIHVINNNGMGDFLQLVRHIPALSAYFDEIHVWDVAFKTRKHRLQMNALLARSKGFEKVRLQSGLPRLTRADIYCEMFALPFALHATRGDHSAPKAYLSADPDLVARWSSLVRRPGRLSVAFGWSSGHDSKSGWRNIGLTNFADLFDCHDRIDFFSIQNTAAKFDLQQLDRPPAVTDFGILDLEHMAALMNAVDLVILPDGGLSHIAGSIGAKLWVGVHKYSDWRWGRDNTPLDLYGSARVFRQPTSGDWRSVCDNMKEALIALADEVALQPSV